MLLERLGSAWKALQASLNEEVRVLVVDDEEIVRQVLEDMVELCGYQATCVADAEEAIRALREGDFDLLLTDKNLPGSDGIDLIAQARSEGMHLPAILVTAYPSVRTISRALKLGASDYITKPFDDITQVQRRVTNVVEAQHTGKLVGRIVQDLQSAVGDGGVDAETVRSIGKELFAYKQVLSRRPEVIILDPATRVAELTRLFLQNAGMKAEVAGKAGEVRDRIGAFDGPLCLFLSLELPGALELVPQLVALDPGLEIVISASNARLEDALEAVNQGATDLVLGSAEGLDVMCARVKRAAIRARRRRLYLHLVATLYRTARQMGAASTDALTQIVPEAHRGYLEESLPVEPGPPEGTATAAPTEIELDGLFDDEEELVFEVTIGPMDEGHEGNLDLRGTEEIDSPEARISRGISRIDPDRMVELPLRSAMQIYSTLGEFLRFFHDAERLEDPQALQAFLGDASSGALAALARAYFEDLRQNLPEDIRDSLGSSDRFGAPLAAGERATGIHGE